MYLVRSFSSSCGIQSAITELCDKDRQIGDCIGSRQRYFRMSVSELAVGLVDSES